MTAALSKSIDFKFVHSECTRILAVDDDPIQREFAAVYLSAPTTEVDTADSAEAGLSMLENGAYDLLLLDIDMPGMNGIELVKRLRADPRFAHLPIVMATGREDIVSIDSAYEAGATSFVTKPVNWRVLSYHLRFVLRAEQARPAS
jgi:DNA-binding response OmpR family regulator